MPSTNFYLENTHSATSATEGTFTLRSDVFSNAITSVICGNDQESKLPAFGEVIVSGKKATRGIHPLLYFKYIKSQFKPLERTKLNRRLKILQKAFDEATANGQYVLAEKFLQDFVVRVREAKMAAKGVKYYVDREDVFRHKRNIREGHISDTMLKDFTRVIPKKVLKRREQLVQVFDDFVIYHYWNENSVRKDERMSPDEKAKMRDPVLFGIIKENNRLYFVMDWEDDVCDLSFAELTEVVAKRKV